MKNTVASLMFGMLGMAGCSSQSSQMMSAPAATSADLKQMIQFNLAAETQFAQIQVSADAKYNLATLSGLVPSESLRAEAVKLTQAVQPDLIVIDQIEVQPPEAPENGFMSGTTRRAQERQERSATGLGRRCAMVGSTPRSKQSWPVTT